MPADEFAKLSDEDKEKQRAREKMVLEQGIIKRYDDITA
jgi:hypothetical protein